MILNDAERVFLYLVKIRYLMERFNDKEHSETLVAHIGNLIPP